MDSELTCPVCTEVYTRDIREPVLLPECGHTFCRKCLCNVESFGQLDCPTCRRSYTGSPVSSLPTIFALLSLSEKYRNTSTDYRECSSHGSLLEFWCRQCQEALCGHCLLAGHLLDGHAIEKGTVFVAEKKQEILANITHLVKDIDTKKNIIIKQMAEVINQITLNTEESQELHHAKTKAEKVISDMPNLNCIESAMTSLVLIDSLQTGTRKIALSRPNSICEKCTSCYEADMASSSSGRDLAQALVQTPEEDTEEPKEGMNTEPISPTEREAPMPFRINMSEVIDRRLNLQQISRTSFIGDDDSTSPTVMENEILNIYSTASLRAKAPWPLCCCVVGNDGRRGKLRWENYKLHMYCLSGDQVDAQFMIQLSVVEWLISAESPEVFLDLGSSQHHFGRIYIRLYGHMRRAQHFLALCLGSLGPSYKFSKFHGVAKRGAPGETLAGGRYITAENTISIRGLIPGLEWGGEHIKEKKAGLVVGASGGRPSEDAFFHLCTKDHIGRKFACVFGEVVEGLHVLNKAVQHLPQLEVTITNVGVILSHGT